MDFPDLLFSLLAKQLPVYKILAVSTIQHNFE